jgi:hypothetical protein
MIRFDHLLRFGTIIYITITINLVLYLTYLTYLPINETLNIYYLIFFLWVLQIIITSDICKSFSIKRKVHKFFLNNLNKEEYIILNNVTIKTEDGKTSKVNHLLISVYGIFVVKTKNLRGDIYIEPNKTNSTLINPYSYKKTEFYNPVWEEYKNKEIISKQFNIEKKYIYDIVIFVGKSNFKIKPSINVFDNLSESLTYIKNKSNIKIYNQQEFIKKINIIKNGK